MPEGMGSGRWSNTFYRRNLLIRQAILHFDFANLANALAEILLSPPL